MNATPAERPTATATSPSPQPGDGNDSRGALRTWAADLGWRTALVVVAAVLAGRGAPALLVSVFTGLAAIVVIERVVRHRRRGMLDAALVGFGMLIVVLGLLGLLLDYVPGGITRISWSIGLVLLAIGVLTAVGSSGEGIPPSPFRSLISRSAIPTAAWGVAVIGILTTALVVSVHSYNATHVAALEMSTTGVTDGFATITVSSGTDQGPFEIDLLTSTARTAIATGVKVSAGTATAVSIAIPADRRLVVQLVDPDTTRTLRQLIFDSKSRADQEPTR